MLLNGNEKLTFVEGSIRRSIGPALVEAAVARDSAGGRAARLQAVGKVGAINVSADALLADGFTLNGRREGRYRDARVSLDAPIKLGQRQLAAHADTRLIDRGSGDRTLTTNGRLSSNFNGFNLTALVNWQRSLDRGALAQPDRIETGLIGTGRLGAVRVRGEALWDVLPDRRFRTAEVSAYWSQSDRADWEGALAYDRVAGRARARVSHVRRFSILSAAASLEAGTDGAIAAGLNLNFSLDASGRGIRLSNQRLASTGSVEARVYRDLNDNGTHDRDEPLEQGATITTGPRVSDASTGADGIVRVDGLAPFQPVAVGIDTSTLADPSLTPRKALQTIVPRPGIAARLEIGLVGAGDVEGALVRDDGRGFEGLDVELVDAYGRAVATGRSDYDGFFLFERVAYGRYTLRLKGESARSAGVETTLSATINLSMGKSLARLGAIRVIKTARLARAEPPVAPATR